MNWENREFNVKSWYELSEENEKLEGMIHIYQREIEILENENDFLKQEVIFLKEQLEYKTMGPPIHSQDDDINIEE